MEHPDYLRRIEDLKVPLMRQQTGEGIEDVAEYAKALQSITKIVRDADNNGAPNMREIIEKAGDILGEAIDWAYCEGGITILPSYAHDDTSAPLVEDPLNLFGYKEAQVYLGLYERGYLDVEGEVGDAPNSTSMRSKLFTPDWKASRPPHAKSTRLSRFCDNVAVSSTDATPIARMVLQARCEVYADVVPPPVCTAMAPDCSALVVLLQGGWKNHDPILGLCLLDESPSAEAGGDNEANIIKRSDWTENYRMLSIEPGFGEIARHAAIDASRKLAIVADDSRIKTFFYGHAGEQAFGQSGWAPARGTNVHTLDSEGYDGPVAILPGPGGRVVRAGKGGLAFWDLDALQTHEGGRRVGEGEIDPYGSWRDKDYDPIELSVGSSPSTTVRLGRGEEHFHPAAWKYHGPTGHMLVGERERKDKGCARFYALDLDDGARKAKTFLGHGGLIGAFSVSAGDANVFATGCSDGHARLYDVRHPLPVATYSHNRPVDAYYAVELAHPDGIPILFTGGEQSQGIKVWDIRAQAVVYELATGNNSVPALAWDERHSVLYAATLCPVMDHHGSRYGYRPAKIPNWAELASWEGDGGDMNEVDYDSDSSTAPCWPEDAFHSEASFGYAYDAGKNTLLAYSFKEDPDPTVLPEYGDAGLDGDM